MAPTPKELEDQNRMLQQYLAFARDDASQQKMQYEEARETLRDRLAMAALAGLLGSPASFVGEWVDLARDAYAIADAMLQARNAR